MFSQRTKLHIPNVIVLRATWL